MHNTECHIKNSALAFYPLNQLKHKDKIRDSESLKVTPTYGIPCFDWIAAGPFLLLSLVVVIASQDSDK